MKVEVINIDGNGKTFEADTIRVEVKHNEKILMVVFNGRTINYVLAYVKSWTIEN